MICSVKPGLTEGLYPAKGRISSNKKCVGYAHLTQAMYTHNRNTFPRQRGYYTKTTPAKGTVAKKKKYWS
jgi:hypothetical protein